MKPSTHDRIRLIVGEWRTVFDQDNAFKMSKVPLKEVTLYSVQLIDGRWAWLATFDDLCSLAQAKAMFELSDEGERVLLELPA